jgi:prevent-host-death family protein
MSRHTIGATEFRTRCLELLDRGAATGNPIVITKRGKPVARLVPVARRPGSIAGALRGLALDLPTGEWSFVPY